MKVVVASKLQVCRCNLYLHKKLRRATNKELTLLIYFDFPNFKLTPKTKLQ